MAILQTYQDTVRREDLMDVITNISPKETPMLSNFAKVKVTNTYAEWPYDSLASAADNAKVEGASISYDTDSAPSRTGAYTQIFVKTVQVSGSEIASNQAGVSDMYAYQMKKRLEEMSRDIEDAIVTGTGNSGASGTARRLKGVLAWMTTNVETGTGTGSETLTETMLNDALQTVWNSGGRPDSLWVNGWQKRKISSFSTNTRNVNAAEKTLIAAVDVYDSDFGRLDVMLDRYMTTSVVAILQSDKWAVGQLRPVSSRQTADTIDGKQGVIIGELTLVSYNEAASGQITGLSVS